MFFKAFTACLLFSILGLVEQKAYAQENIPADLQAAIFFKVLSYDKNIDAKKGSELTIYLVADGSNKDALLAGFKKLKGQSLKSKKIDVTSIGEKDIANVGGNSILYAPAGASASTIKKILAIASAKKIPTLGGSAELAQKGFAVGLFIDKASGKPKIIINHAASQSHGMNLSSRVLGLAKVINK